MSDSQSMRDMPEWEVLTPLTQDQIERARRAVVRRFGRDHRSSAEVLAALGIHRQVAVQYTPGQGA